jgi:hypothetical protein
MDRLIVRTKSRHDMMKRTSEISGRPDSATKKSVAKS